MCFGISLQEKVQLVWKDFFSGVVIAVCEWATGSKGNLCSEEGIVFFLVAGRIRMGLFVFP